MNRKAIFNVFIFNLKNIFSVAEGIFNKNGREKKCRVKVSIILEYGDVVEDFKDFEIQIDSWDVSFYDYIVKINEEEIEKFRKSKKFEWRI